MKTKTLTVILLIFIFCSLCFAQPFSATKSSNKKVKERIEELIIPLAKSNNFSGSVLVQRDGKKVFSGSYGLLNREKGIKNTAQSKFFLASISAIFTSATTMKLVDEGKLSLEDKVSKFFR